MNNEFKYPPIINELTLLNLHDDILKEIMSNLDLKSFLILTMTCKKLNSFENDLFIWKKLIGDNNSYTINDCFDTYFDIYKYKFIDNQIYHLKYIHYLILMRKIFTNIIFEIISSIGICIYLYLFILYLFYNSIEYIQYGLICLIPSLLFYGIYPFIDLCILLYLNKNIYYHKDQNIFKGISWFYFYLNFTILSKRRNTLFFFSFNYCLLIFNILLFCFNKISFLTILFPLSIQLLLNSFISIINCSWCKIEKEKKYSFYKLFTSFPSCLLFSIGMIIKTQPFIEISHNSSICSYIFMYCGLCWYFISLIIQWLLLFCGYKNKKINLLCRGWYNDLNSFDYKYDELLPLLFYTIQISIVSISFCFSLYYLFELQIIGFVRLIITILLQQLISQISVFILTQYHLSISIF